jgi:hypothetical protein
MILLSYCRYATAALADYGILLDEVLMPAVLADPTVHDTISNKYGNVQKINSSSPLNNPAVRKYMSNPLVKPDRSGTPGVRTKAHEREAYSSNRIKNITRHFVCILKVPKSDWTPLS